ncbi:MAG: metallophosphoesterase [Sulfolobales archaeon]
MKKDVKRILFATDLHGSNIVFRKMLAMGRSIQVDLMVMGGDISGKILIPITENSGDYRLNYHGQILTLHSQSELDDVRAKIANEGNYTRIVDHEELERMKIDQNLLNSNFQEAAEERIREWIELADSYLAGTSIRVLISGGNDDTQRLIDAVEDSRHVVNVDQKVYSDYKPFDIVNIGFSNPTPFSTPREVQEDVLESMIDKLMNGTTADKDHLIFNIHAPPINTTLDLAPKVNVGPDGSLSISLKGGEAQMVHAGSTAVRKAIEKYQPALSLHGHIHESRAAEKIGSTLCINPGSAYTDGTLNSAVINIRDDKIIGYQLPIS